MNVNLRQKIERAIVSKLLKVAIAAGYTVSVEDDTGEGYFIKKSNNQKDILKVLFQMDEDRIYFTKDGKTSCVYCVYGNDGWDVICDYHLSLEHLMPEVNKLSDFYLNHFC